MLTKKQLQLIHVAKRQLGLDDADYREVLREKGGVGSSKALTVRGLEDVMAHFEHMGFRNVGDTVGDYWRKRQFDRGIHADARQLHLIRELAAQQQYLIEGLCERFSHGRASRPQELSHKEASSLLSMLRSVIRRGLARSEA